MLLDCGLMFPDPTCSASTWCCPTSPTSARTPTASRAASLTHGHEDHVGGLSFLLRELSFPIYGSALTLGLARNRIEEAGLLGRTELIPVADGERRKIGPFDVEFIPVTHSVPHGFATAFHTPQGMILHTRRLQARPHAGRRPAHRPRPHRRDRPRRRRPAAAVRLDQRRGGRATAVGDERRRGAAATCSTSTRASASSSPCFASHIHRIQQIADAAIDCGRTIATLGPVDEARTCALAREMGLLHIPDDVARRHRRRRRPRPGEGVRHLHRLAGRADVGAGADGVGREQVAQGRPSDDTVILSVARHPRQRGATSTKVIDGLHPARRRGRALGHRGRARHAATPSRRSSRRSCPSPGPSGSSRCTASTGTSWPPRPPRARRWACADDNVLAVRGRRRGRCSPTTASTFAGRGARRLPLRRRHRRRRRPGRAARPAGARRGGRGRRGRHRRRPDRRDHHRPRDHHPRAGSTRPRPRTCSTSARDAVRDAVEAGVRRRRPVDIEALQRDVRRAAGKFVNERTRRRPMIVPVVMEA